MQAAAVSPATLDLAGNRGEVVSSTFTIINTQSSAQTYYLDTLSFSAKNNSGEPLFSSVKSNDELSKWIQLPSTQIDVPPRSKIDVPFSIHIPADAASQSFQSAITVSDAPSEIVATNGAIIQAKTAILIFLTVNGALIKKGALLDFLSDIKGLRSNLDQTFTYRIQNQGNVYFVPTGTITLKDVFGRSIYEIKTNTDKSRVLPNSTRSFSTTIDDASHGWIQTIRNQARVFTIGPVTSVLQLNLGEGFKPIQATTSFWYFPFQLLLTCLSVIVLVIVGYSLLSNRKRK